LVVVRVVVGGGPGFLVFRLQQQQQQQQRQNPIFQNDIEPFMSCFIAFRPPKRARFAFTFKVSATTRTTL